MPIAAIWAWMNSPNATLLGAFEVLKVKLGLPPDARYSSTSAFAFSMSNAGHASDAAWLWYSLLSPNTLFAGCNWLSYWLTLSAFTLIARTIASRIRRSSNGALAKLKYTHSAPLAEP